MTASRFTYRAATGLPILAFLATLVALGQGTRAFGQQQPLTLSGPYSHENLTVFLVHGTGRATMSNMMTLDEALKQKQVVVHETGEVNALALENVGKDNTVLVQAGDIVKGGQQDRLIASDLLLGPRSGKLALPSFCVEQGRWSQRGPEPVTQFASSPTLPPSRALRLAGNAALQLAATSTAQGGSRALTRGNPIPQVGGNGLGMSGGALGGFAGLGGLGGSLAGSQSAVWSEVGAVQDKLGKKVGSSVQGKSSPTSLVLTLEEPKVKDAVAGYVEPLARSLDGKPDVLGYIFAINGQVAGAELYNSADYFRKLWPRLLNAVAVEAVAERDKNKVVRAVPREEVAKSLIGIAIGQTRTVEVNDRTQIVAGQAVKLVFTETRDRAQGVWVHRTFLMK